MIINKSRDHHLNIYRLYKQSDVIENNLTRALALCLQNDALFFREFITPLIPKEKAIFNHIEEDEFAQRHHFNY